MTVIAFPGHAGRAGRSLAGARSLASRRRGCPSDRHCVPRPRRPSLAARSLALARSHRRRVSQLTVIAFPGHAGRAGRSLAGARSLASSAGFPSDRPGPPRRLQGRRVQRPPRVRPQAGPASDRLRQGLLRQDLAAVRRRRGTLASTSGAEASRSAGIPCIFTRVVFEQALLDGVIFYREVTSLWVFDSTAPRAAGRRPGDAARRAGHLQELRQCLLRNLARRDAHRQRHRLRGADGRHDERLRPGDRRRRHAERLRADRRGGGGG